MFPEAKTLTVAELRVGLSAEFERDIDEADVLAFARNSGDFNPLHVDAEYAGTTNFQRRIAHGALQFGLASAMLGMHLPGRNVLLGSANARFLAPLYFPARVRVRGEISSWSAEERRGTLLVVVRDATTLVPTSEISIGFTLHEQRAKDTLIASAAPSVGRSGSKLVLVTGASGGIGQAIVQSLARDYSVIALVNRTPLDPTLKALPQVTELALDLDDREWEGAVRAAAATSSLYGIVHCAWPGAPAGGLLTALDDVIERQVSFGSIQTIRLARLLFSGGGGGRLIVLGSTYGTAKPNINLSAYSLGKAVLENTVRLLGPELARKEVTINAICPTVVAAGMNKQVSDRQRLKEAALIPMGRLCSTGDITSLVDHLLSETAGFISGQIIALSGAQL